MAKTKYELINENTVAAVDTISNLSNSVVGEMRHIFNFKAQTLTILYTAENSDSMTSSMQVLRFSDVYPRHARAAAGQEYEGSEAGDMQKKLEELKAAQKKKPANQK